MNITRRAFIKGAVGIGSALVFPERIIQAAGDTSDPWSPAYAVLAAKGLLTRRVDQAYAIFEACRLCPRQCGVNRLKGEKGFCRATAKPVVYSAQPHFGEEASLVGRGGSGTWRTRGPGGSFGNPDLSEQSRRLHRTHSRGVRHSEGGPRPASVCRGNLANHRWRTGEGARGPPAAGSRRGGLRARCRRPNR